MSNFVHLSPNYQALALRSYAMINLYVKSKSMFKDIYLHEFDCINPNCNHKDTKAICFHGVYETRGRSKPDSLFNSHVLYHFHECGYFDDYYDHITEEQHIDYSVSINRPDLEPKKCPIPRCTRESLTQGVHIESSGV